MKNFEFDKIRVEQIKLNNSMAVKKVYKSSFPLNERVPFKNLFSGVFKDFALYGFYFEDILVGFVHLFDSDEFVHINYLAVANEFRNKGIGSYIINWLKNKFNNKSLVADVENIDHNAKNNEQRYRRLKFYYQNGFVDGLTEFDWEGTSMFYIYTNSISDVKFMKHIRTCFPTIKNLRPHKSNVLEIEQYIKKQKIK